VDGPGADTMVTLSNIPIPPSPMDCSIPALLDYRGAAYRAVPGHRPAGATHPWRFAITWGLDDKLKTHIPTLSIFQSLASWPSNFRVRSVVCGAFAHRLLQEEEDPEREPSNLRDPQSKDDLLSRQPGLAKQYYAGTQFPKRQRPVDRHQLLGKSVPGAGPILGSVAINFSELPVSRQGSRNPALEIPFRTPAPVTGDASHVRSICNFSGQPKTTAHWKLAGCPRTDQYAAPSFCFPSCATIGGHSPQGYDSIPRQFSSLFAWRSVGNSAYNAASSALRHKSGDWNSI